MISLLIAASLAWGQQQPNVILVTMDTTRADALGAYGGAIPGLLSPRDGVTPNLDEMAGRGVRFDRFYAHAPTTLNSHTSLFTGRDPHEHAVPRNGYGLPNDLRTLTEQFADAGYDTLAVVAAKALERDMGLTRGFRLYDDQMSVKKGPMYQDIAEGVVRRTRLALDARDTDKPLFLWVHFYDPHGPYSAPDDWFGRFSDPNYDGPYADPETPVLLRRALRDGTALPADVDQLAARYLAEVHYMDHHIGELFSTLSERALLEHALVVVTADHGETLSEVTRHAYGHGAGVDEGVLRVPLLIEGYGMPVARSAVVHIQVDMAGLAPTVATLVGLDEPLGAARSFAHLVRPGPVLDTDGWPSRPSRPSFSEATRKHREALSGWNNADLPRAVRVGGLGMQVIPARGEREERVVSLARETLGDPVRSLLKDLLFAWDMASPEYRVPAMSTDTMDALEALGYIHSRSEDPGDHPEPSTP